VRAFADLRLNRAAGQTDESFWPSFTDIMMVVVMIFLITSAVLILRNWELIRQISETAEAERTASEQARVTLSENATLEERLAATEQQLNLSRLQQLRTLEQKARIQKLLEREQMRNEALDRERGALETQLAASQSRSRSLSGDLDQLRQRQSQQQQELATLRSQMAASEQQLSSSRAELSVSREQFAALQIELSEARQRLSRSEAALAASQTESQARERDQQARLAQLDAAREQSEISEERLAELRAEYVELQAKYDKLVRPARTTKGKYVVALRYSGRDGQRLIELKGPADAGYQSLSEAEMHRQLSALKAEHGQDLYIRIIFPDDSQLPYSEAWKFTADILSQYDYYYQDGENPVPGGANGE
jgi:DNA repair exonuclease SbcCD ATPase subunit